MKVMYNQIANNRGRDKARKGEDIGEGVDIFVGGKEGGEGGESVNCVKIWWMAGPMTPAVEGEDQRGDYSGKRKSRQRPARHRNVVKMYIHGIGFQHTSVSCFLCHALSCHQQTTFLAPHSASPSTVSCIIPSVSPHHLSQSKKSKAKPHYLLKPPPNAFLLA